jgi:hypothetical protein
MQSKMGKTKNPISYLLNKIDKPETTNESAFLLFFLLGVFILIGGLIIVFDAFNHFSNLSEYMQEEHSISIDAMLLIAIMEILIMVHCCWRSSRALKYPDSNNKSYFNTYIISAKGLAELVAIYLLFAGFLTTILIWSEDLIYDTEIYLAAFYWPFEKLYIIIDKADSNRFLLGICVAFSAAMASFLFYLSWRFFLSLLLRFEEVVKNSREITQSLKTQIRVNTQDGQSS